MFDVTGRNDTTMDPILYRIDIVQSEKFLKCNTKNSSNENKVYNTCLSRANNISGLWLQITHV